MVDFRINYKLIFKSHYCYNYKTATVTQAALKLCPQLFQYTKVYQVKERTGEFTISASCHLFEYLFESSPFF